MTKRTLQRRQLFLTGAAAAEVAGADDGDAAAAQAGGVARLPAFGALIGGFAFGGENDLMPYLAGRYFGTHAVSKVFGWFLSAFVIGAAVGPVAFAKATSFFGGPTIPLYTLAAVQTVPALLFMNLGPYREKRLGSE